MRILEERAVKLMCQQKRLNIWLEHYPGTQGVKSIKADKNNLESILGNWNV